MKLVSKNPDRLPNDDRNAITSIYITFTKITMTIVFDAI